MCEEMRQGLLQVEIDMISRGSIQINGVRFGIRKHNRGNSWLISTSLNHTRLGIAFSPQYDCAENTEMF